jgi:peroxiredoxin family protein
MSNVTIIESLPKSPPGIPQGSQANLEAWFEQRFNERIVAWEDSKTPCLSIMVTKGTLDWAYPAFIISSTAAAMGWDTTVFFTFYGLSLLKKDLNPAISPLGNPAMPMKMPFGPKWFQSVEWNMPNMLMANVPGFESVATALMKQTLKNKGVAPLSELRGACIEAGVKLIACQMTVDLFGWKKEEFIPEISEWAGAATYLDTARHANVTLFI